jgi:DNA-binding LacI/PurR family transcriptional regulator
LSIYTGIDAKDPGEDYQVLLDDITHDRIAGLMFASSPFLVNHTPILEHPGIPRVIMGEPNDDYSNSGYVNFDTDQFARKACSWLKEQGCSTVAILQQPGNDTSYLLSQIKAVGVECPYQWQQSVPLEDVSWARNVMRLLFDGSGARPDALIVTDDNLFDPGLSGILDAGVRIPQDLKVLTHSNFPWTTTSPVPTTRLGYDMNALLKEFISELESQRAGNAPQRRILKPVFESEIQSAKASAMLSQ